jgi:predicted HTH domain antitoxin
MDTVEVVVTFPRSLLAAARVRESELDRLIREYVAVELYRQRKVSLGKATELAGIATKLDMMAALARHDVWLDYTAEDAAQDWETLREVLGDARR